jgi:hypothetical protein
VRGRASLGKLPVAGDAAFESVRYGGHVQRGGHTNVIERVIATLGPGGVWAGAGAGWHAPLGPGGVWAAADAFERFRHGLRLVAQGTGAAGATKSSVAPYP